MFGCCNGNLGTYQGGGDGNKQDTSQGVGMVIQILAKGVGMVI